MNSRMNSRMMNRTILLLVILALLPANASAQRRAAPTPNAIPIMADDGSPVSNHRIAAELKGAAEKLPGAVVAGNPKGDVTLVEFYDLNCPYCRRASNDVDVLIAADKKLKLVLVPFPVLGVQSILAGRVELSVAKIATPEQFYAFHRKIYEGRGVIDGQRALSVARDLKLDEQKILSIADDDSITETMKTHVRLGNQLGLQATPAYVIGDIAIIGHPGRNSLKYMVESMRSCGKAMC
jgi:protein-disulfide isomerase